MTTGRPISTRPLRRWRRGVAVAAVIVAALASVASAQEAAAVPLASRSGPRGATMFAQLPPERTGIRTENRFEDPRMRGELYQEFEGGSIGTGVAIGDYDADGRPDVFVVSKTESCRLFRNLGDFRFEDVTAQAGVGDTGDAAKIWKGGVTFADVNNDGRLDLYLCRFDAPNLLYVNQGNGTFKEEGAAYGLNVSDASVMAAFCDYDRDGWLDVYLATNMLSDAQGPRGRRGYMFHNERNGTFRNVTEQAGVFGETRTHSATWWDYDHDGWPDLYVAYDYGIPDTLYHNNRNGTFTDTAEKFLPHTSFSSMGSDFGDVNNDGLIDFFVTDMAGVTHEKDQHIIADARARLEERADGAMGVPKYHRNALLLATGTGYCREAAFLAGIAATDWTWSPRLEDLDNDGLVDLHVTNGFPRDPDVDVVKRQMSAVSGAERVRIMYDTPMRAENNLAFRNRGDLQFEDVSRAWGLDQKGVSFGAALGDLDGDGDLDLIYSNYRDGVTVLRNDSDEGHRLVVAMRGTTSNRFGVGATVTIETSHGRQARQLGLARGYMSSSEPVLHFGLGGETTIRRLTATWPSGHVQTLNDVAADTRLTLVEPEGAPPTAGAAEEQRRGQFSEVSVASGLSVRAREEVVNETSAQPLIPFRFNRRGPALAIGSLAGTGRDDIVVGGTTLEPHRVLLAEAPARFATAPVVAEKSLVNDGPLLVFDVDGDGHNDLLVTRGGNSLPPEMPEYQPALYFGDGRGGFRAASDDALPAVPLNVGAAAAADFDRDGRLDAFLGGRVLTGQYPFSPRSALLVNRGGRFEDITDTIAPELREVGMVTAALWSDIDDDGWPDLLLAVDWGTVKCFRNSQGRGFEDWTERAGFSAAGTGWWSSLAAADFNGDGRPDFVAGNAGLNTRYHAEPQRPALLYAGDVKGDGSFQLVEGYYEGDTLYPRRARRDLGVVFPSVLKRFPLNRNFARATLDQIFGREKLDKAQRFAATELRSGVFLSSANGTYRFEPLPRLAQIAPAQGIATGDFDGDGQADVYLAQNWFGPIAAVSRFDGGLSQLLRGDGQGHFVAVAVADSGLIVPGDAKALAVLDLDANGWPDFLVSRNNDTMLAFRNDGLVGRQSVRVILRGPAGNPTGVGAKVVLERADGSVISSEVYAGSGSMSQSSPACFFGYAAANPPRAFTVRWPSGATTRHPFPAGAPLIELSADASTR